MNTTAELKALEERAYKETWQDGILDVIIGAGLVLLGILFRTDIAGLAGMFVAVVLMPFWAVGKKLITVPRLGHVQFGEERRARERGWMKTLLIFGVGAFLLAVGIYVAVARGDGGLGERLTEIRFAYILFGALIALGIAVSGALIGLARFQAYAAIVLVATGIGYLTGLELEDFILASGIVILVCGAVVLGRFVRRYPLPSNGGRR